MKAAIFEGKGILTLKDILEPKLEDRKFPKKYKKGEFVFVGKDEQVKLKVLVASICGTDLHILNVPPGHDATPGIVLGHEYVGEVTEIGSRVKNVKVGDRVVVDPNIKCGMCYFCRNDMASLCRDMTTLGIFCDGGFAEYNVAPAKQLFAIPKDLDIEKAIFFEPLTCATHAWSKLNFKLGDSVLIFGAGPMGCYFIELARLSGASKIFVSEPSEFRRKFAKKLKADVIISPERENLLEIIKLNTFKNGFFGVDVAVDACGIPEVIKQAMDLVKPGGKISTFGEQNINAFADKVSFTKVTQKELQIIGSYATTRSADQTINILTRSDINLKKLITHRIKLDEIHKGMELMRKGEAIESVVYPK
ncbi:MAG: L-threonine 3-dehydrogenase [Parcubacteria group bacterium CG11_big_fil_rev_8_21_14_0_20_39_14]|nr:MAG: L-threonine 3-dehydrogenase [Parcubacteria group bacterium CG11_big_fil_rev_8_21_14_0_20_39_14]